MDGKCRVICSFVFNGFFFGGGAEVACRGQLNSYACKRSIIYNLKKVLDENLVMSIDINDVILKKRSKSYTNIDPCDIVSVNQSPMNQILEILCPMLSMIYM